MKKFMKAAVSALVILCVCVSVWFFMRGRPAAPLIKLVLRSMKVKLTVPQAKTQGKKAAPEPERRTPRFDLGSLSIGEEKMLEFRGKNGRINLANDSEEEVFYEEELPRSYFFPEGCHEKGSIFRHSVKKGNVMPLQARSPDERLIKVVVRRIAKLDPEPSLLIEVSTLKTGWSTPNGGSFKGDRKITLKNSGANTVEVGINVTVYSLNGYAAYDLFEEAKFVLEAGKSVIVQPRQLARCPQELRDNPEGRGRMRITRIR